MARPTLAAAISLACAGFCAAPASAAEGLPGGEMGWPWILPFAGILLSIALGPLLAKRFWHRHYGKIAGGWALLTLAALAIAYGIETALAAAVHAMLSEYVSFIALLFALYTVAGGILVTGTIRGTPRTNTVLLGLGTVLASVVGTTGAAMILIRPLLRANEERRANVHVVVFFIFLVANIGGALTPLGDPPLFLGFLNGVDFFWTARHLAVETVALAAFLLLCFFLLDTVLFRREHLAPPPRHKEPPQPIRVQGLVNLALIGAIIAAIILSAAWKTGPAFSLLGSTLDWPSLARDAVLVAVAFLSLRLTPDEHRAANGFTWEPIKEVAKLFAAIFITIAPVLAILQAGEAGTFAPLLALVSAGEGHPDPAPFFWLTGVMSAFLDNAPTYLLFFKLAGGDAQELMGPLAEVLAAISMGAVYMGALTYIGNAPNFMVYAIAVERGVRMPGFFGYLIWSCAFLLPAFAVVTLFLKAGL